MSTPAELALLVRQALDTRPLAYQENRLKADSALDALLAVCEEMRQKADAYDRARARVKIEGATRAEWVLRADSAEAALEERLREGGFRP